MPSMEAQPGNDQAVGSEQRAKAQEFKNSGNEKFNRNNYKGAIVDYQKGLLHEPNNPDLHANLSAAYLHLEKYIEAEEHALFAIHLRPNFYKGYMRAAKADHGKGMTKLALKRLAQGLSNVSDPNGLKELNRLKNQYTAYLSLQSNNEREMEFDSDTYQSEDDEDEGLSTDDDSGDDQSPPFNRSVAPASVQNQQVPAPQPYQLCGNIAEPEQPPESAEEKSGDIEKQEFCEPNEEDNKTTETEPAVTCQDSKDEQNDPQKDTPYNTSEKKTEHPLERLRELARTSEMKKNIADFKENLKIGGQSYLSGNYRKAADNYKAAYERVGKRYIDFETDERQCNVIRYASYVAMINLNTYDDITKGLHGLNDMTKFGFDFPAIYIQIARAYFKLNRFKTALKPLEKLQDIIGNCPIFPTFIWPGTDQTMEETTPVGLKNYIKELNQMCRMSHKPTAICRFDNCLKTSSHIVPSELIYSSDPDFIGFVRMICEEKCHIEFHVPCWKSYKESVCGVGKVNDKDFLGRRCLTTDCINSEGEPCIITLIEIIGNDGQVKSINKLDPKANAEQKAAEKKAKKKKSKLDDKENKEKVAKPKKPREKKVKEKKQVPAVQDDANVEEEDYELQKFNNSIDPVKALQNRKESLRQLRKVKFGLNEKNNWDPRYCFYGLTEESVKASGNRFLDHSDDSVEVKDAKEFLFSYFQTILKDEGPLKLAEVEDLWKESAGDFCDITVVLPNLTSMCDLLMESTLYCQLEDRLCLAEQLEEAYQSVQEEVVETVTFLMTGAGNCETDSQQTDSVRDHEDAGSYSGGESDSGGSTSDSEDSGDEGTDDEDKDETDIRMNFVPPNIHTLPPPIHKEAIKSNDDGKFSLEDMLKEMTRMKNILEKGSEVGDISPATSEKDQPEESNNETFETAYGGSANTTLEDLKIKNIIDILNTETSNNDQEEAVSNSYNDSEAAVVPDHHIAAADSNIADQSEPTVEEPQQETQEVFENSECDKGSQSEVVTEERHIQTAPLETKDRLSQTKESDLYKELNKKMQELSSQLAVANKENTRLTNELANEKQVQKTQHDKLVRLCEENQKEMEACKARELKASIESTRKEREYKKKEEELIRDRDNLKEKNKSLQLENDTLKKNMSSMVKDSTVVQKSLTSALNSLKEYQENYKAHETKMKGRLQKALHSQLVLIKSCWETQLSLHKKRCVEKITEMQSWFSISPGEVESLPSYPLIEQNILHWMDMAKQLQQIESNFQDEYSEMERRIKQGNEMEDLKPEMLPMMPKEPLLPPLERIHKEIVEKHLKTISELTQLVATQQLEIKKSKDQNEQLTQMLISNFGSNQLASPVTTAFGGLALQYPFPTPPQFPGPAASNVPSQDTAKLGNHSKLTDVHTLLQESSKMFSCQNNPQQQPSLPSSLKDEIRNLTPASSAYAFHSLVMPPPQPLPPQHLASAAASAVSMPPPLIGVAHNLLKNSSVPIEQKKDAKVLEQRAETPRLQNEQKAGSSRESTPGPTPVPVAATPEKTKKKKKAKSGEAAAAEARIASAVSIDSAPTPGEEDNSGWNVVLPKSAIPKHSTQPSGALTEHKLKNKKKLLEKLQARFATISVKDLDDIVKQVRENNNGSLSGLPFDEIEARVERIITKRQVQKNSTMGLVKFSVAAWGTVKPQEAISWSNLQLEECAICLEPMANDRTKVDCNHEFHTKCLRKWLKEKSVCPLCNKFTTMPDEFPAL